MTTNTIIKPTIGKLKKLYLIFLPFLKLARWGIPGALILFFIGVSGFIENCQIKTSYKESILHEIQVARNKLDYTLTQRQLNVRSRPNFSLEHSAHVSESFADNLALKTDIMTLYQSLSSAQESAKELMVLLSQSDSTLQTIQNKEGDMIRAISLADKIGPRIAKFIGSLWHIPPPNMTLQQKIKFYENEGKLIYSASTDSQIAPKWNFENQ